MRASSPGPMVQVAASRSARTSDASVVSASRRTTAFGTVLGHLNLRSWSIGSSAFGKSDAARCASCRPSASDRAAAIAGCFAAHVPHGRLCFVSSTSSASSVASQTRTRMSSTPSMPRPSGTSARFHRTLDRSTACSSSSRSRWRAMSSPRTASRPSTLSPRLRASSSAATSFGSMS